MAGINGIHVRASVAFLDSPRMLKLTDAAQALWLHLHKYALAEKREFLPIDYDTDAIAAMRQRTESEIRLALDELTAGPRPIINELNDGRIRVRGAREKQPLGWRDETDAAETWNLENPEDPVEIEDFGRAYQSGQKRKSETGKSQGVPRSQRKRTANAPQTRGKRTANAPRLQIEDKTREEKNRQTQRVRRSTDADSTPDGESAPTSLPPPEDRIDSRLVRRFDERTNGWGDEDKSPEIRDRALSLMALQADRILAYVAEINKKAPSRPWVMLRKWMRDLRDPNDRLLDQAKRDVRYLTEDVRKSEPTPVGEAIKE